MSALSPLVSEFATAEDAKAYELWLRETVAASLADERPSIAHDEAMARIGAIVAKAAAPDKAC